MKRAILLFIIFIPGFFTNAQNILPGGVPGVCLWKITQNTDSGSVQWAQRIPSLPDSGLAIAGKGKTMNQNPALSFNSNIKGIEKSLNLGTLKSFSLFTVCQELDTTKEQAIISMENDSAAELVLTNRRMALLDAIIYTNYDKKKHFPRIYSYTQNKSDQTTTTSQKLRFGQSPKYQSLPISAYTGLVPEMIVFNRNLSLKERLRVESYLALKYGISLNQDMAINYLNSRGEVIWDADLNAAYSNNIAGIGRDEGSGLTQPSSESLQTPGLLKISINRQVTDKSFLIWGDDNGELSFSATKGAVRNFGRTWKISASGNMHAPVSLTTDVLSLSEINPLATGETYWLMIDRSGKGNYPFGKTDFVKCTPMPSSRGTIQFSTVVFDKDSSGNDIFTLLAAPGFFTKSSVVAPTCTDPESGLIQTEIVGGIAPYQLFVQGITNTSWQQLASGSDSMHVFEGIPQGTYIVKVIDAQQQVFNETVTVSNRHIWQNSIGSNYSLPEGGMLQLDASKDMPVNNYTYSWKTPDGVTLQSEKISISQPGNYLLSVTDNEGCNSTLEVAVQQISSSIFNKTELFPNPVTGGWFVVRISLNRIADVHVSISDFSGRTIQQSDLKNDKFYWYSGSISGNGIYFVTLTSGTDQQTLKMIVQ